MSKKWPYFEVEYNGSSAFTAEMIEQALREGDINADQSATELFANGLGPDKKVKGRQYLKTLEQHLKALKEHPEEYTRLYNIQYNINHYTAIDYEAEPYIFIDEKTGNIKLEIEMFYPKGADLIIDGDKAIFDDSNLNTEKARALISLLKQNNLVGDLDDLKLHDANKNCTNWVDKATKRLKEEEEGKGHLRADIDNTPVSDEDFGDDSDKTGSTGQSRSGDYSFLGSSKQNNNSGSHKSSEEARKALKKANEAFEKWLNKNKVKGRSWTFGHEGFLGEWTVFTAYAKESRDPFRKPVETARNGDIKYNYEFQIRTRVKNGKLEVEFSVPPGAELTKAQAKLIASAFTDAGIKYVEFNGMTDVNAAAMRLGCAAKAVVPTNHKIDTDKFKKMIAAAKDEMDEGPAFFQYRYDLAMQVGKNLMAAGIDWRANENKSIPECRRVRWAVAAYELNPFRNLWEEHGLLESYMEKTSVLATSKDGKKYIDAAYAIGAKMAVSTLYNVYSKNRSSSVSVLLGEQSPLNKAEKDVLSSYLKQTNTSLNTKVFNVPYPVLLNLYEEIFKTQYKNAKESLESNFIEAIRDSGKYASRNDPVQTALALCAKNAEVSLNNMKSDFRDYEIPDITLRTPQEYGYNFDEAYKKAEEQGLINPNISNQNSVFSNAYRGRNGR